MKVTFAALREELLARLSEALDAARKSHAAAVEGATHSEARSENDKDTRGLEQSYLARGHAQRVAELDAALAMTTALRAAEPVNGGAGPGSIVTLQDDDDVKTTYLLAPGGGGLVLAGGVKVVTPSAPLSRAMVGKRVDDEVKLGEGGKSFTVVALK